MALPQNHYVLQANSREGKQFLEVPSAKLQGIFQRLWNWEPVKFYQMTMLIMTPDVFCAQDIRRRFFQHLDCWEKGKVVSLMADTCHKLGVRVSCPNPPPKDHQDEAKAFNAKVLSGHVHKAVWQITDRGGRDILDPEDTDAKSGLIVAEALHGKYPPPQEPAAQALLDNSSAPTPLPFNPSPPDLILRVTKKLSRAAFPSGLHEVEIQHWLYCFGPASAMLQ